MGSWRQHILASRAMLMALLTPLICLPLPLMVDGQGDVLGHGDLPFSVIAFLSSSKSLLTPLICLPLPLMVDGQESRCAYVVIVMAVFWVTETFPLSVTAFLPVVFMPLMGVLSASEVSKAYMSDTLMMGLGAMTVAIGIETWNLHKRIALRILLFVGSEPRWLMLGLMLATWFLSMWISNTATTTMMIPITEAILQQLHSTTTALEDGQDTNVHENGTGHAVEMSEVKVEEKVKDTVKENSEKKQEDPKAGSKASNQGREDDKGQTTDRHFKLLCTGMSLSICYAANCGGIATLTGTGPNLIMKGFADDLYLERGEKSPINFTMWMALGFPLSAAVLIVVWLWLQIAFLRCRGACNECRSGSVDTAMRRKVKNIIRKEYEKLGPISFAEGSMLFWFALMVLLWVSRDLGGVGGWQVIFKDGHLSGSTVSVGIATILYFYPSTPPAIFTGRRLAERHATQPEDTGAPSEVRLQPLLTWNIVQRKMPWGLYLLLGGGFALAKGCEESGLSQWVGHQLQVFSELDRWGVAFILCYITAATTEVTSNSAISTLLMPILASLALNTGVHPLYYMFAGVIASSFAFMLPVATPPNALVFSYGRVRIIEMVAAGAVLNLLAVPLLVVALGTWGDALYDFQHPPDFFFPNTTSTNVF